MSLLMASGRSLTKIRRFAAAKMYEVGAVVPGFPEKVGDGVELDSETVDVLIEKLTGLQNEFPAILDFAHWLRQLPPRDTKLPSGQLNEVWNTTKEKAQKAELERAAHAAGK